LRFLNKIVFTGASCREVWKLTAISHCPARLTKRRETRVALPWNGWCSQRITMASGKSIISFHTSGEGAELASVRCCSLITATRPALVCWRVAA
jgi:hypothetical protein